MLDKFMNRLMEGATAVYMPRLEEMAKAGKEELEETKAKVWGTPTRWKRGLAS